MKIKACVNPWLNMITMIRMKIHEGLLKNLPKTRRIPWMCVCVLGVFLVFLRENGVGEDDESSVVWVGLQLERNRERDGREMMGEMGCGLVMMMFLLT